MLDPGPVLKPMQIPTIPPIALESFNFFRRILIDAGEPGFPEYLDNLQATLGKAWSVHLFQLFSFTCLVIPSLT